MRSTPGCKTLIVGSGRLKMDRILGAGFGGLMMLVFALIYSPGGTIVMALSCNSRRLDGWDWVLSVIIPAYGLIKALFNVSCR